MNRNFIAFMLSCSTFFTVSESAMAGMASDKIFGDWENGFVNDRGGSLGDKWECGAYVLDRSGHADYLRKKYEFIELVVDDLSGARKWSIFQNPVTKAYIAADNRGYCMSVRKN